MFYPFKRTTRAVDDPGGRIERYLSDRVKRVIIGLYLSPRFEVVSGSLLITTGQGKFLRLLHADHLVHPIPEHLRENLAKVTQAEKPEIIEIAEVVADLADAQAYVADQLKRKAGKYVDRVLALAPFEHGILRTDFDGRPVYIPLSDATRLAELTGLSVINQFQERDLLQGGNGESLFGLPYWLLFADRDAKVATETRLLLVVNEQVEVWLLPASDGSDQELPEIKAWQLEIPNQCIDNARTESSQSSAENCDEFVQRLRQIYDETGARGVFLVTPDGMDSDWISAVTQDQQLFVVNKSSEFFYPSGLAAMAAGFLGLLHIDQAPANLPFLTGARNQRILGKVTPGVPANYRQLLRCMSDFSPPAMKLRDAV